MQSKNSARTRPLRADAQRNVEQIRRAALVVFGREGLTAPLELVAQEAGVTKGTVYHRFHTREELVDAVVEDLAREHIEALTAEVETLEDDAAVRFEHFLLGTWLLQYDQPAVSDVLTKGVPGSALLSELCARASAVIQRLLQEAQHSGQVRPEVTTDDLYRFIWERGLVLRSQSRPGRDDYRRACGYLLAGLRTPAQL